MTYPLSVTVYAVIVHDVGASRASRLQQLNGNKSEIAWLDSRTGLQSAAGQNFSPLVQTPSNPSV
jgi:hypothetical protein